MRSGSVVHMQAGMFVATNTCSKARVLSAGLLPRAGHRSHRKPWHCCWQHNSTATLSCCTWESNCIALCAHLLSVLVNQPGEESRTVVADNETLHCRAHTAPQAPRTSVSAPPNAQVLTVGLMRKRCCGVKRVGHILRYQSRSK